MLGLFEQNHPQAALASAAGRLSGEKSFGKPSWEQRPQQPPSQPDHAAKSESSTPAPVMPTETQTGPSENDFELVVGRRQIATWLFVGILVLGVATTFAYMAGKASIRTSPGASTSSPAAATAPRDSDVANNAADPSAASQATSSALGVAASDERNGTLAPEPSSASLPQASTALPQATIMRIPALPRPAASSEDHMFAEPEAGKTYLQIGAVTKGMAVILAEGLRSHGFDAFVAPGPSTEIFRVLIGPLKDAESYRRAKAEVDSIELGSFVRRYEK
jgi:cell division septation protein DedD